MAQLKQLVNRPDVVEMHDATAQDPKLLIHLKVCGRKERERESPLVGVGEECWRGVSGIK